MQKLSDARYDSIADFLDARSNELANKSNMAERDSYMTKDRTNWYGGFRDGKAVEAIADKGWEEGTARLSELRDSIGEVDMPPQDRRRKLIRAEMGDSLDIHSVFAGRLDTAWTVAKRRNTHGPQRIDLLCNMIAAAGDDADVLFWRGAAAVVLSDMLTSAGYVVRIVVGFGGNTSDTQESVSCRITVKDHDAPLDIGAAAAVLCPGFFRALGHSWVAGHARGGLKSACMSVRECKREEGEVMLSHEVNSRESAIKWLKSIIAKINAHESIAA